MVQGPYLALAAILLTLAILFAFARLPKITHHESASSSGKTPLLGHGHLLLGTIGIFVYVGGEVSIGSFLVNFMGEKDVAALPPATAAGYVSLYWGGAMVGRFIGFAVMRHVSPGKVLAFNATCSILLILTAVFSHGHLAMWAILAVGLCNSIMFPTIFSMALHRLGEHTARASAILCMAIVGGAIVPFFQGFMADHVGLHLSFLVPAACYTFIVYYGVRHIHLYAAEAAKAG
jgi:FHS family L-fucose permease-like MFS transporter